jgi:AcrR family transcriptional regulator
MERTKRARGRPRQFEQEEALDAALKIFWKNGFGGTSLDDLTAAMKVNRPSVYAAFGNKEALYEAAVDRYVATLGREYLAPLSGGADLATDLTGFYRAVIDGVTGRHGPSGCVVACTLPAEAGTSRRARKHLATVLDQLDSAVRARFVAAHRGGEIASDADPAVLAQVITSGMLAISIRARAGAERRELSKLARNFVALVAGSGARPKRS